jgi:pimeloyl-ACP methyl ester carboxylesterase
MFAISTNGKARQFCRAFLFCLALSLLSACNSYLLFDPADSARKDVRTAGWTEEFFPHQPFGLIGFRPANLQSSPTLDVYIEGDGYAWRNLTTPSHDPTPLDPIALHMAIAARNGAVLYLARPCQYQRAGAKDGCNVAYWTSHRFAPEVVDSLNNAINKHASRIGAKRLRVIGYSGGGVLAALVAAKRNDVDLLVTAAAPLDHAAWTTHHDVTPLRGSLNPVDFAGSLGRIRQIHLLGEDDKTTPLSVLESYRKRLPSNAPIEIRSIKKFSHSCCWSERWNELVSDIYRNSQSK